MATIAIADNVISITLASVAGCCAVIVSKKANGKYIHNEAVLGDGADFSAPADAVLPTYPVGNENYLNGGDIFGQQESFNPGGDVPPTPSPTQSSMSGVTVNGANVSQNGQVNLQAGANAIVISINAGTDGASYGVAVIAKTAAGIGESVAAGSQTSVVGATVNLSETAVADGPDKAIVLCRNNIITQVWGTLKEPVTPSGNTHTLAMTGRPEVFRVTVGGNTISPGAAVEDGVTVSVEPLSGAYTVQSIKLNGTELYEGSTPVTFTMPAEDSTLALSAMDMD